VNVLFDNYRPLKNRVHKRRGTEIIKAALESINIKTEIKKSRGLVDDIYSKSKFNVYAG
jgi:hypothetical protein